MDTTQATKQRRPFVPPLHLVSQEDSSSDSETASAGQHRKRCATEVTRLVWPAGAVAGGTSKRRLHFSGDASLSPQEQSLCSASEAEGSPTSSTTRAPPESRAGSARSATSTATVEHWPVYGEASGLIACRPSPTESDGDIYADFDVPTSD